LVLFARIIHATHDMTPSPEDATFRPEPFLYWDGGLTAATAIIKRYVFVIVTCIFFEPWFIYLLCAKTEDPTIPKTYLFMIAVAMAL
jgi:hypothetical protein